MTRKELYATINKRAKPSKITETERTTDMNIKLKLFAAILAAALFCGVLNACSAGLGAMGNFNDLYKSSYTEEKMPDQLEEVAALAGYTMERSSGNLGLFYKDAGMLGKNYLIYNFDNNAVVKQKTIALSDTSENTLTLVQGQIVEKMGESYTLYDQLGNVLAANSDRYGTTQDLILVGNTVYRINTDTYAKAEEIPFSTLSGSLPSFDEAAGGYYYQFEDDSLAVFSHKLEYIAGYTVPQGAKQFEYFALNSGNVVLQYLVGVDSTETEYDLIEEGTKYLLKTVVLDVQTGLAAEQTMNCKIISLFRKDENKEIHYLNDKVTQAVAVAKIENYALSGTTVYAIAEDGVLESELNPLANLYDSIGPLTSGYYYAVKGDRAYLLSGGGNYLGDITGTKGYNRSMIATEHEVYNYNMERIVSVEDTEGEMRYQTATADLMFFANADGKCISVSATGAKTVVADGENTFFAGVIGEGIFGIRVSGAAGAADTYRYYDSTGKALLGDAASEAEYTKINQAKILSVTDADGTVRYYRLSVSGAGASETTKNNKK